MLCLMCERAEPGEQNARHSPDETGGEAAMETVMGPDSKEERIERMVALYQLPLLRL